jgi:hypothetical protein
MAWILTLPPISAHGRTARWRITGKIDIGVSRDRVSVAEIAGSVGSRREEFPTRPIGNS